MTDNTPIKVPISLDRRKERILRFVVEQFIQTGSPVGSRTLSKLAEEHLSPASIRNTMSDLEELGLLSHPHVSAGRMPTEQGYRYYVDSLMNPGLLPRREQDEIDLFFGNISGMLNSILENSSRILSAYSQYIGIVTLPRFESIRFKHIEFVRQGKERVLVVFVSNSGLVYNKLIRIDGDYPQEELDKISRWVVDHFRGYSLGALKRKVEELLRHEQSMADDLALRALLLSSLSFKDDFGQEGLFIDGTLNLLKESDLSSTEQLEVLLKAIEQKSRLIELINGCLSGRGVQVVFGSETGLEELRGCSLVAGSYNLADGSFGSLAVLGPTRMLYPRTVFLVDYISRQIARITT